jgi:hypothetical protein
MMRVAACETQTSKCTIAHNGGGYLPTMSSALSLIACTLALDSEDIVLEVRLHRMRAGKSG